MAEPRVGNLDAECSYTWTIMNFSSFTTKVGDCIKSPNFTGGVEDQSPTSFFLKLFPNGCEESKKGWLSLFMCASEDNGKTYCVDFSISLLNQNDVEVLSTRKASSQTVFKKEATSWGSPAFISRNKLMAPDSRFLLGDTLKVRCKLWGPFKIMKEETTNDSNSNQDETRNVSKSDQAVHFNKLCLQGLWQQFIDQQFVDVAVVVQKKQYRVHKAVLAAHSPVFAAMFNVDMLESRQNTVTIEDCEPRVFEALIKWIYLGRVDEIMVQVHSELLALADKYNIDELKVTCEHSLSSKICVNNAITTLQLADLFKASLLKSRSLEFIKSHISEISISEDWPSLVNNPKLLEEVTLELASLVKTFQQQTLQ